MIPACVAGETIVGEIDAPTTGAVADSIALARPKSSTFTCPPGVNLMFAGLRSRWTMPF